MAVDRDDAGGMPALIAGRYEVRERLGVGGMGAVLEALDRSTGEPVALKFLHARLAKERPDIVALFKREFYTLRQLSYPLFVEVFDYGVDEGRPFFTMELLPGRDLAELAPLPWEQVCRILRDVAGALAILHSRGLVYRDLSAHNVRLDADGKAKLLDFGALASVGAVQKKAIGTPPYLAPEALHMRPLDGRSDLFALGALGYFLLTGTHAYPARRLDQLRDLWRSNPRPPSRTVECPPALEALLLSSLNVEARARPAHAAEVIDRLGAIADLPPVAGEAASCAYLTRPILTDRKQEVLVIRKRVLRALRGRGGVLRIEGPAGRGRSRLLDELAMEGKLLGATVLHAQARPGAERFDLVQQLVAQLRATLPELAEGAIAARAQPLALALGSNADGEGDGGAPPPALDEQWAQAQGALLELFDGVCSRRPLVVAVDDLHLCDDASAAVIAGLTLSAPSRRLLVAATLLEDAPPVAVGPVATFREHAHLLEPCALDLDATTELYRTVFGDVAHLPELAHWAHPIAAGNPGQLMALAQDLVDRRVIHLQEGAWVIPAALDGETVPGTLGQAFEQRVGALGAAARCVAGALVVAGDGLDAAACMELCPELDDGQVFGGLDELLRSNLLVVESERYRFREQAMGQAVDDQMGADERRRRHRAVGRALLERGPDSVRERLRAAWHLLHGGDDGPGLEQSVAAVRLIRDVGMQLDGQGVETLVLALEAWERLDGRAADGIAIRLALLTCAFLFDNRLTPHGLPAIERLEQDSGMADVLRGEGEGTLVERVVAAMGRAGERHAALPEDERVFDPLRSTIELGRALLTVQGVYCAQFDVQKGTHYAARFEPLAALTPLAKLAHEAAEAAVHALRGRLRTSLAMQASVAERTAELLAQRPDPDPDPEERARLGGLLATMDFLVGLRTAFRDPHRTLELAARIDDVAPSRHRPGAAQMRLLAHYLMGDAADTRRTRQEFEQCLVRHRQHGSAGVDVAVRMRAYCLGGDLPALKELSREAEQYARHRPGYRPFLLLVRAHADAMRGELDAALALLEEAAALAPAGEHNAWAMAIAGAVHVLVELGRHEEAQRRLDDAFEANEACDLDDTLQELVVPTVARLQALRGELVAARAFLAEAAAERAAAPRLMRVELLLAELEVDLIAADREAFERHAAELRALLVGTHQGLGAACERLMDRARAAGVIEAVELTTQQPDPDRERVSSALSACTSAGERANRMLTILADALHADGGYLFALRAGQLELAAAPAERPSPPAAMVQELSAYLEAEVDGSEAPTVTAFDTEQARARAFGGREYRPVMLWATHDGAPSVVGVAALEVQPDAEAPEPRWPLLTALGEELLRAGDADPLPTAG